MTCITKSHNKSNMDYIYFFWSKYEFKGHAINLIIFAHSKFQGFIKIN